MNLFRQFSPAENRPTQNRAPAPPNPIRNILLISALLFFLIPIGREGLLASIKPGEIRGIVLNQDSLPLPGVLIRIPVAFYETATDSLGRFKISEIPPGVYRVEISGADYSRLVLDSVVVRQGQVTTLGPLILLYQSYNLPEMVITATRSRRDIYEVSQMVNVIDSEQIQERNAKTSAEALREEEGIFIQKTSHGGGSAIIRGLSSNRILILVDGIRLNNSTFRLGNHQYLTTVDNQMLDRIEVVQGPGSVLYGSDALGGTINLITRRPPNSGKRFSSASRIFSRFASADNERSGRGELTLTTSRLAVLTGISLKKFGDLKRGRFSRHPELEKSRQGVRQSPSGFSAWNFDTKIEFTPSSRERLVLAFQLDRQSRVPRYDKYENNDYFRWIYHPQKRDLGYFSYENDARNSWLKFRRVTLSYQRQQEGRQIQKERNGPLTSEKDDVRTPAASVLFVSLVSNHRLTYGIDFSYDKVFSQRTIQFPATGSSERDARGRFPDDARYSRWGIFLQDEISFNRKWILIAGSRFSRFSTRFRLPPDSLADIFLKTIRLNYQALTGSLGLVANVNESLNFTMNLRQGFRAPNLSDLSKLGESKGDTYEIPNFGLKPEKLTSLDLGVKLHSTGFSAGLSLYYSRIRDIISSSNATLNGSGILENNGIIYKIKSKQNIGSADIRGVELNFFARLPGTLFARGNFSYTYGQNIFLNEPVGGIPPAFGFLGLVWKSPNQKAEFYTRFAGRQARLSSDNLDDPRIPPGGTPGWFTLNLRWRQQIKEIGALQAAVENILDLNYREHGSGINGPGRNFILSFELSR